MNAESKTVTFSVVQMFLALGGVLAAGLLAWGSLKADVGSNTKANTAQEKQIAQLRDLTQQLVIANERAKLLAEINTQNNKEILNALRSLANP